MTKKADEQREKQSPLPKKRGPKPMPPEEKARRAEERKALKPKREIVENPQPGYTIHGVKIGRPKQVLTEEELAEKQKQRNLYTQKKNREYLAKTRENYKQMKSIMRENGLASIQELASKVKEIS